MSSFREKADNAVLLAAAIGPMGVLTIIVCLIGLAKCSVTKPPDVAKIASTRLQILWRM